MKNAEPEITTGDLRILTAELDVDRFISDFNDRRRFEPLCRQCPNWGNRWGCPPFDSDVLAMLAPYSKVRLYCIEAPVVDWPHGAAIQAMTAATRLMREATEPILLEDEHSLSGLASLFTGMCYHCGDADCARRHGQPCRHPELVRPSLEALGFDISKTMAEVFGFQPEWYHPDKPTPRHLRLLGAVFFNP